MAAGATENVQLTALGTPNKPAEPHTTSAKLSSDQDKKGRGDDKSDSDSDTAQEDEVAFRLRELANEEEDRFKGLKREHWW